MRWGSSKLGLKERDRSKVGGERLCGGGGGVVEDNRSVGPRGAVGVV